MVGTKKKNFRLQVVLPKLLNIASLISLFVVLGVLSYRYYNISLVYMNLQKTNDKLLDDFNSCSAKRIEAQEKADKAQEQMKNLTFQMGDVKNRAYQAETANKVATDDLSSKLEESSGKLDDCIEDNAIFEEEIISMQGNLTELKDENNRLFKDKHLLMDDKADLRKQIDMLTALLSKEANAQGHSIRSQNGLPFQPAMNFDKFPPSSDSVVMQDPQTISQQFDAQVNNQQLQQRDKDGSQEQQQITQMQNYSPNFDQHMFRHENQDLPGQRISFFKQPTGQNNPNQSQGYPLNQKFNHLPSQLDQGKGYVHRAVPSAKLQGQNIGNDFNSQQPPNQVTMQQIGSLKVPQQQQLHMEPMNRGPNEQPVVAAMNRTPMKQPVIKSMNMGLVEHPIMESMNRRPNEHFYTDNGNQDSVGTTESSTESTSTGNDLDEENESVEIKVGKYAIPGQV